MGNPSPSGGSYDFEHEELVRRVAWLYYENNLNQQEIADILGLSRSKVLRLLKDSRDSGIVTVRLDVRTGLVFALEKQLCHLGNLRECFVVPDDGGDAIGTIAKAMAYRFNEALRRCRIIGVGGGRTLHAFARELSPPDRIAAKEIVALVGSAKANLAIEPYDIASTLVNKLPVEVFHVWGPARVERAEEAETIMRLPAIRTVLQKAERADISFVGIGDMRNSAFIRYGFYNDKEVRKITAAGAVGEILGRFYDIDGKPLEEDFNRLYISVRLPARGDMIGVAGGQDKFQSILGALRTGWLSGLITDETTARALASALAGDRTTSAGPVRGRKKAVGKTTA